MTPDPCGASCEPAEDATAEARSHSVKKLTAAGYFATVRQMTDDPVLLAAVDAAEEAREAEQVRAEIGECTRAGDHEDIDGVCVHCGAELEETP